MAATDVFLTGTTATTLLRGIYAPGSRGIQATWSKDAGLAVSKGLGLHDRYPGNPPASLDYATSSVPTLRGLLASPPWPSTLLDPNQRIEILVESPGRRPRRGDVTAHVWSTQVPSGSFLTIGDGMHLCSPAFLFVQQAPSLGLVQTINYGNELCGLYSVDGSARGMNDHPAFTTPQQLQALLDQCRRGKGVKIARHALRWVIPSCRSPKESETYLLTCLPRDFGGYAIRPRPEANATIEVPTDLRYLTRVRSYEVDLLWRDCMAVVEYDGSDHNDPEQRMLDDTKTHVLQSMGYLVIRITWEILRNPREFDSRMRLLGERLGITVPPTTREFERRRTELRTTLFGPSER